MLSKPALLPFQNGSKRLVILVERVTSIFTWCYGCCAILGTVTANAINVFERTPSSLFIETSTVNRSQLIFSGLSSETMLQGLAPVMRLLPLANRGYHFWLKILCWELTILLINQIFLLILIIYQLHAMNTLLTILESTRDHDNRCRIQLAAT